MKRIKLAATLWFVVCVNICLAKCLYPRTSHNLLAISLIAAAAVDAIDRGQPGSQLSRR